MSESIVNKQMLLAAGRNITYPLVIPLQNGTQVICEKTLRILPGKRLTLQGIWLGKPIVAKIFLDKRSAKRHAERDNAGIAALHHYKFNAPKIYYSDKAKWPGVYVLLYEFLTLAQKVKQTWEETHNMDQQTDLISKLVQTFARQHTVGMLQQDLHLNNFMLRRGRIYCLDGDGMRYHRKAKPLSLKKSFHNLALFLEHLTNHQPEHIRTAFLEYCAYRNIPVTEKNFELLKKSMQAVRNKINRKQMEKTLRDCSSFVCTKSLKHFLVYDRTYDSPAMRQLMQDPNQAFTLPSTEYLKQGNSSTVAKFELDGRLFVIKRYNVKNKLSVLKRFISKTRARRSWLSSHYLKLLSVNTVKPIALYEKKLGIFYFQAFFIAEYSQGEFLYEVIARQNQVTPEWDIIADSLLTQLHSMFDKGITHGDLKAENLLIMQNKVILLDLDSVHWHRRRSSFNKAKQLDLARVLSNFVDHPSLYDYWQARIAKEFN